MYLAGLRSKDSGRYEHAELARELGGETVEPVLRAAHREVFQHWLDSDLKHQEADLRSYVVTQDEEPSEVLDAVSRAAMYRRLIPASARDIEAYLFLLELETTLALLRAELSGAGSKPAAKEVAVTPSLRTALA
jgi:hypothetical protein